MVRIYPDPVRPKPSPMEASSRFWCGAAVGLLIGLSVGLNALLSGWLALSTTILLVTACVVGCGALALRYGEDFWDWIRNVLHLLRLG